MTRLQSDIDLTASLDAGQRDYLLGRINEIQRKRQDAYRDASIGGTHEISSVVQIDLHGRPAYCVAEATRNLHLAPAMLGTRVAVQFELAA